MKRMERSPFLHGNETSPAMQGRENVRLLLLLTLTAALAWLGGLGPPLDVATLRPAFATIGALRETLEGVAAERRVLLEDLARERGRRVQAEKLLRDLREENRILEDLHRLRRRFPFVVPETHGDSGPAWRIFRVLGVTPSGRRHEFVIDGGLADGIELGAAVTAFTPWGLALAGRVVECGADAARVLAVTDPSSTLPVRLEAQGSGLLFQGGYPRPVGKLLHLRREVEIEPRAEVRLTDLSNAGGALIGWIVRREVETNRDGSVTQHVEVLPAVDPARLRFVWVEGQ